MPEIQLIDSGVDVRIPLIPISHFGQYGSTSHGSGSRRKR
jgi:hypothetical protein